MIEDALSEEATDLAEGLKAWLILLVLFGFVLGLTVLLGMALDGWGEKFANVASGIDGFVLTLGFVANIAFALVMLVLTCLVLVHLVAGANRLMSIYNRQRNLADKRSKAAYERLQNYQAQQKR